MPSKTERILSYLPRTFQTVPRPPVLFPVADAFGNELLRGENSLAEIMLSHWVDFADQNAERIKDLERIGALYGLAPRRDDDGRDLESVEEFREHLKHYVRTFLEGTVTVQGILRITAEALGLRIADETEDLDRWWTREKDDIETFEPRGDDAADLLRFESRRAAGAPARSAKVTGTVDLNAGIGLTGPAILRLRVDGADLEIDLAKDLTLPAHLSLAQIRNRINEAARFPLARDDRRHLILASAQRGPASRLELLTGANDVASRLLGLKPRTYHGAAATAAQLVGRVDLSQGLDLSSSRFLRIEIDSTKLAEIDCAGTNPTKTSLPEIVKAINQAFNLTIATDDGKHLILASPKKGFPSSVRILAPAAQSAATLIFGEETIFASGQDDQPARVTSTPDLRGGIDLSEHANLRLLIDAGSAVTINCAGADPAQTQRGEIVSAINEAFKAPIASLTAEGIDLTSPTSGAASRIVFETAPVGDAATEIFGVGPVSFAGSAATVARLVATPELTKTGGVNPWAQNILSIAVDGGPPVEINLLHAAKPFGKVEGVPAEDFAERLGSISLDEVVKLINDSLHAQIAATDGEHLFFTSPTSGGASSLEINPLETIRRRRFITRAIVTDEATRVLLGVNTSDVRGAAASRARLIGTHDLSPSVDLSGDARLLRLAIDSFPAFEVACAGPRARATLIDEIVKQINVAAGAVATALSNLATHDGKHLILSSPSSGGDSRVAIEPPHAALQALLGIDPQTLRGRDDAQVKFVGTVDLSAGIELDPKAAIKLGFDDKAPAEISLAGPAPNRQTMFAIINKINTALLTDFASTDAQHIVLTSPNRGPAGKVVFAAPSGKDVTKEIFGISAPRAYQGDAASPARVVGRPDISAPIDLRVSRFLSISLDGGPVLDIDCAVKAARAEAATLDEVVNSINSELKPSGITKDVASHDGKHLILTSPTTGVTSRVRVEAFVAGDARQSLFGDVNPIAPGKPATPASLTGEPSLSTPINLSKRSLLRLAVNGGRPRDIDIAGEDPAKTLLDEVVSKINAVFPDLATATDDRKLKLTSPAGAEDSRVSVLPVRFLEVIEYAPETAPPLSLLARHGKSVTISNDGAADTYVEIGITAPDGEVGPSVVNETVGWSVRFFAVIEPGERVVLGNESDGGLHAEVISPDGSKHRLNGSQIMAGPLGPQAFVPSKQTWRLVEDADHIAALQLNNPNSPTILLLRARQPGSDTTVKVVESDLTQLDPPPAADAGVRSLIGRLSVKDGVFSLVDAGRNPIATLRAGPRVDLTAYKDKVVKITGPFHADGPPLLIVSTIAELFDVTIHSAPPGADGSEEHYKRVTIGAVGEEDSLARRINSGTPVTDGSAFVSAVELEKATVLSLRRGQTRFRYLDCLGSRFDQARFDRAHFPDGICGERGIFDVSRFSNVPPERVLTVFASTNPLSDPPVRLEFRWQVHQPGTFIVNLPADLSDRFGARFNEARFSQTKDAPELYEGAVAEPPTDRKFITNLITDQSSKFLKTAEVVPVVDRGWSPVKMPFRKPQRLTLGKPGQAARLYLAEAGLDGFIKLEAKADGAWGNDISVAARQVGPAIYDVSVFYLGGRFESAREVVLGQPVANLTESLIKPGPVGVLQAKAAGVKAEVTRDRAEYTQSIPSTQLP
jgi:hypothetical protein